MNTDIINTFNNKLSTGKSLTDTINDTLIEYPNITDANNTISTYIISTLLNIRDKKNKHNQYIKKYYEEHKDKCKEITNRYYIRNVDKIKDASQKYYNDNKDKVIERQKIYYANKKNKKNNTTDNN